MGYRSDGALWLSEEAKKIVPDEIKEDLNKNWDYDEENDIWKFTWFKWYEHYKDVSMYLDFFKLMDEEDIDYDFIRVGEEDADIEVRTNKKFYCKTSYGVIKDQ
jgi:hypothetical protein